MAYGRGRRFDRRADALTLGCGRPGRLRPGCHRSAPPTRRPKAAGRLMTKFLNSVASHGHRREAATSWSRDGKDGSADRALPAHRGRTIATRASRPSATRLLDREAGLFTIDDISVRSPLRPRLGPRVSIGSVAISLQFGSFGVLSLRGLMLAKRLDIDACQRLDVRQTLLPPDPGFRDHQFDRVIRSYVVDQIDEGRLSRGIGLLRAGE